MTVKKKVCGLTLALLLFPSMVAGLALLDLAASNFISYLPVITIKSDGSIEPSNTTIIRQGNTYSLTANITREYALVIECSNIVLDGGGYAIDGSVGHVGFANHGLELRSATNVTVKNISVTGFTDTDIVAGGSYCRFINVATPQLELAGAFCTVTECDITEELASVGNNQIIRNRINTLLAGSHNYYAENNITTLCVWGTMHNNTFTKNNFLQTTSFLENLTNQWSKDGIGNNWFDYEGKDENNDGIGDTPYLIKAKIVKDGNLEYIITGQDNHPLMYPYDIENDTMALPIREPLPEPEPFPTALAIASVAGVAVGAVGLLVYFKKRKHAKTNRHSEIEQSSSS